MNRIDKTTNAYRTAAAAKKIRGSWNGICPVTRVAESGKAYKRAARKQQDYRELMMR